ncbi:MAG: phenylalanine--tRNA ligase subunit beta [Flavobacteriaceae bacterium]|nr:phenylalanine--tRNA ligase subunit beta [Flavobacteriaceae bacterium]MDB4263299.1 phenylalanine--tRNA ligase subunit beta [Flavobacteriaceae bacterium]MDG1341936.1 phenylalanine--tRNA ligase subunit beta [Flavobacteriaceae bacterium]MDG1883894.1 phenylalanine--tRNA ligase subunit beta [Flavobacteriaceae bacterium]MDG1927919.1 phenylalanine--tRNA ligase subunit beta [Flavobacteriaceae bacterium]
MKISYNWLQQFLTTELPIEEISVLLTDLGLEVEGTHHFESIKGGLKGVLVGEVLSCEQHPNADRLKKTEVNLGNDEIVPIVCGAPNVAKGQKVLVATVGTTLSMSDGTSLKINKSKIRGEVSMGMICAEDELGLGESHDGIMVLDETLEPGTEAASLFEVEEDYVFEIGLTPNRADAMSHMGVARDLKAICMLKNIPFEWTLPETTSFNIDNNQSTINVDVKNGDKCSQYYGLTISGITVAPSPTWLQNRLKAIGIGTKNNVVDVTNYVLHELGQPLHAFDAQKIDGDILVKTCSDKTSFTTLDGNKRELHHEDLMICDSQKPLCIAGIFGGLDSGVTEQTTSLFLESAYFDPVSIRKTAKRHGLNTDASFRFERGIDPEIGITALKRAAILIKKIAGGEITSEIQDFSKPLEEPSQIFLGLDVLEQTIGQTIQQKDLNTILNALEININNVSETGIGMTIPRYRVDVNRPADVIEEILRVYGYNNLEDKPLKYEANPPYSWKDPHKLEATVAQKLIGHGYIETINNSLTSPEFSADFHAPITLLNPLGKELSLMRQSLVFNALEVVSFNLNRQNKNLKIFEFGAIYGKKNDTFVEAKRLSITLVGNVFESHWDMAKAPNKFFYGKGVIQDILESIGLLDLEWQALPHPHFDEAFEISYRKKHLGVFGLISKKLIDSFGIDQEVYMADLNWGDLIELSYSEPLKYNEVSKFPLVRRDFALLIDDNVHFEVLKETALKTDRKILKEVRLFDVYQGKNLEKGKKSYGLSFTFQDNAKTLTDKQVDKVMDKLKQNFEKEFGAQLR